MDYVSKGIKDRHLNKSPEPKKESRLTSIVDQLLINRAKDSSRSDEKVATAGNDLHSHISVQCTDGDNDKARDSKTLERLPCSSAGEKPPQKSRYPQARVGLVTGSSSLSPEGGASRESQGQQPTSNLGARTATLRQLPTSSKRAMPTDALGAASTLEATNTASSASGTSSAGPTAANPLKSEGISPEPESSSPSVSPHSPSPARGFPSLFVPGFGLAGLGLARPGGSTAPFSPPPTLERFSPANLASGAPAIKQMEMMTRNYSDFMRSLAAKYNNQSSSQDSFLLPQSNGLVRCFDGTFPYKSGSPFLVRNMDLESGGGCLGSGITRKMDSQHSPTPVDGRNANAGNASSLIASGISPGNASDFSSSQTLLNLVRTASAQSASQLENYLKGAVKRTADGENRLDPLDLSVANKRPKLDSTPGGRELRDFRELLQAEADMAAAGECTSGLRSSSSSSSGKPGWMTLLDRRMHSSPTSSSRTSPKSTASPDKHLKQRCLSLCIEKSCSTQSDASDVSQWTVDDVVKFVTSVESCGEYAEKFREQSIDGFTLPLLTEEHLTVYMGLKLGPALKLRSTLARRIGHCAVCMHCIHCHGDDSTEVRRRDSSASPSVSK